MIVTGKMLSIGGSGAGNGGSSGVNGDAISKTMNGADISDKAAFRHNIGVDGLTLNGPAMVYPGMTHEYTITDWSDFSVYEASASDGITDVKNGVITLHVPVGATENIALTITRNNTQYMFSLAVSPLFIIPPQILSPVNGTTDVDFDVTLTVSDFSCNKEGADTHLKTQWEISTGPGYYTDEERVQAEFEGKPVQEYNVVDVRDRAGTTLDFNIPADPVSVGSEEDLLNKVADAWHIKYRPAKDRSYYVRRGATYRVRARHVGHMLVSGWSDYTTFTISDEPIVKPVIASPVDGETGVDAAPGFMASDFLLQHNAVDKLNSSEWQTATDLAFTDVVWQGTAKGSVTAPPGNILKRSTVYYLRMRYKGEEMGCSDYSALVSFTTAAHFLPTKDVATLLQPDGTPDAHFNVPAFSHDGNWLFVGAKDAYTGAEVRVRSGAVYAYKRDGLTWSLVQTIAPPQPDNYQWFGKMVTLAGDSLFVAAGSAIYEYALQGDRWGIISNPVPGSECDGNGESACVSQDGNTLAVRSFNYPYYLVKILTRKNGTWTGVTIESPDRNLNFASGLSISADGTVLAVGATQNNDPASHKASVYIYRLTDGIWKTEKTFLNPVNSTYLKFGSEVMLSPDASRVFAAGDYPGDDSPDAIYSWCLENGEWKEKGSVQLPYIYAQINLNYSGGMLLCTSCGMDTVLNDGTSYYDVGFYSTDDERLILKGSAKVTRNIGLSRVNVNNSTALSADGSTLALGIDDNTQGYGSNAVVIFTEGGAAE